MSVANGLSYHRNDPTATIPSRAEIKEWHREAVRMAIKSRAGWKNRCKITQRWQEEDLEAIRLYAESLGWETREDSDDDGATVIFEKGKQCKLLLLPCKPCKAC